MRTRCCGWSQLHLLLVLASSLLSGAPLPDCSPSIALCFQHFSLRAHTVKMLPFSCRHHMTVRSIHQSLHLVGQLLFCSHSSTVLQILSKCIIMGADIIRSCRITQASLSLTSFGLPDLHIGAVMQPGSSHHQRVHRLILA